jgi:glycosyltransferase involved in cell wall biosynthesis
MVSELWIHALGAKVGGGLTYLRAILPELVARLEGRGIRVVLMVPAPLSAMGVELAPPAWLDVRVMPRAARNALTRLWFDQFVLPWRGPGVGGRKPGRDVIVYCTGSFAPVLHGSSTVTLVRNALYFDPAFLRIETLARRVARTVRGWLIAWGAARCRRVVYPSSSMRALVERRHPRLAPLGAVVPYGVADAFFEIRSAPGPRPSDAGPRFLYVMTYTIQKNLAYVLEALARAKRRGIAVQVVLTSDLTDGRPYHARADAELIRQHDLIGSGHLVLAGTTRGPALLELYRDADACLFASTCESFGHPLVEALAAGKPIVCADAAYAHELCGPHATYVDPTDPEALVRVWADWPDRAASAPMADPTWVRARYSWPAHVEQLVGIFFDHGP